MYSVREYWLDPPDNPCEFCKYIKECDEKEICIKDYEDNERDEQVL